MKETTLALLLAASTLLVGCGNRHETKVKAPTRVTTEVIGAAGDEIGQTYVGIVEEREATAVSFTGMGVVRRVLVSEGQAVGRGQLLAEMDDTQARNTLAAAEAAAMQADDALQRMTMLHDAGSLPEQQWVEVQSKVAQARAQLEAARKNLADCRLTAPVSGVVGTRSVKAGETATFKVAASGATGYQWYYRTGSDGTWTKVSTNGTSATYKLKTKARHNGYQYRCKVTNVIGSVYSSIVMLTVQ